MSKDLLIPRHDGPSFGDFGVQGSDSLQADIQKVGGFLIRFQAGEFISSSESAQVIPVVCRTLEHPDTCGEVLGLLLNRHYVPVLEDVLAQTPHPALDSATRADLVAIAGKSDEAQQVEDLGWLVIRKLQGTPSPTYPNDGEMPFSGSQVAALSGVGNKVSSTRVSDNAEHLVKKMADGGPLPTADELVQLAKEGDAEALLQKVRQMPFPQLDAIVNEGGETAGHILVGLTKSNDSFYINYAATALHEQGSDVIPLLRQHADESPLVREILHGIVGGEVSIQGTSSQVADLIAKLADPNPQHQIAAMQKLHEMGDTPIPDLMRAKGDPAISERASQLLRWHFTGEPPSYTDTSEGHWIPGVAGESRMSDLVKAEPIPRQVHFAAPVLDADNLTELLRRTETCMETLGSLVRIGAPAKTALCEILLRASL